MREAILSQDGWGCQHVNQDTNWEVPSSPEPSNKNMLVNSPTWKPNINNGTDLWEANLRNGGQPPPQPVQKTPWGHTPSTNLGGTWGEDDDNSDGSNVWNEALVNPSHSGDRNSGVSGGAGNVNSAAVGGPQWGQGVGGNGGVANGSNGINGTCSGIGNSGVVGVGEVGVCGVTGGVVGVGAAGSGVADGDNWNNRRDLRPFPIDSRDMRTPNADSRDPIRGGDPRGISGRLNGTSEMWGQHYPLPHKIVGPVSNVAAATSDGGVNVAVEGMRECAAGVVGNINAQWNAVQEGPKDISAISGKPVTRWEDPSPSPQRRSMSEVGIGGLGVGACGKGGASGQANLMGSGQQGRLRAPAVGAQIKPGHTLWTHPGVSSSAGTHNNGAWGEDSNHNVGGGSGANWGDEKLSGMPCISGNVEVVSADSGADRNAWNDTLDASVWNKNVSKTPSGVGLNAGWGAENGGSTNNWGSHSAIGKSQRKIGNNDIITADMIKNSNQYRVLIHAGFKKEEVEHALFATNLNYEEAAKMLRANSVANKTWRPHEEPVSGYNDHSNPNFAGLTNNWESHSDLRKPQQKFGGDDMMTANMIKNTKQYRVLIQAGFKKDDVERALLSTNLNFEEAAQLLRANAAANKGWRPQEEPLSSYVDNSKSNFPGRYPPVGSQASMPFPPNHNILNHMGSNNVVGVGVGNPSLAPLNSMQPIQMQNYLNQETLNTSVPPPINSATAFGQSTTKAPVAVNNASHNTGQPRAQQLRMLVQHIQLAVQSGYLSAQILNQPLAPATLLLLSQLLSNINNLQGAQASLSRGNNANSIQINVAIAKYKQQISNLQSQINAQQAIYIKQQQQPQQPQFLQQQQQQQNHQQVHLKQLPGVSHVTNSNSEYIRRQHDAIGALQGNFSEMSLNKQSGYQTGSNQQSRLNQWKLPVINKDTTVDSADFLRAPGAIAKQSMSGAYDNNMGKLNMQNDGRTWSTSRNINDGWPDSVNNNENKDWTVAQPSPATPYTDTVPEFEPGKPWKGSQNKTIEDDPSITPGSVARSPLPINPIPKEVDVFANTSKYSTTELPPLNLKSLTWSFNPSSGNQNFPNWSDNPQEKCATSLELWGSSMNMSSRGLGSNNSDRSSCVSTVSAAISSPAVCSSNGWTASSRSINTNWSTKNSSWNSNWLLLKNLTAQIDDSTLRTLCMQHGPLLTFHTYLNQGIALCKYATREEANKAQMTLNNCVLSNTTICAESPNETEVQSILQHLPSVVGQQTQNSSTGDNGGRSNPGISGSTTSCGDIGSNGSSSGSGGDGNDSVSVGSGNGISGGVIGVINTMHRQQTVNLMVNNSSNSGSGTNASSVGIDITGDNLSWRQQNPHNHSRPTGSEADLEYLSKNVCAIVDD